MVIGTDRFLTKIFSGLTDETGKFSYAWKIDKMQSLELVLLVSLDIFAKGHKPLGKIEKFMFIMLMII